LLDSLFEFSKSVSVDDLRKGEISVSIESSRFMLQKIGTDYGGWVVPVNRMTDTSICYSIGAGEDVSFDVDLINGFGCDVFIFDPTPRAQAHITTLKEGISRGKKTTVNSVLYDLDKDLLPKIRFFPYGIWSESEIKRFYAPRNPEHVSHSIHNLKETENGFEAQCLTIQDAMRLLGHHKIDLLKMDIEGAEYEVIDSILNHQIEVGILLVEFHARDEQWNGDFTQIVDSSMDKLRKGHFLPIFVDGPNVTFINTDSQLSANAETHPEMSVHSRDRDAGDPDDGRRTSPQAGPEETIKGINKKELRSMNASWDAVVLTASELLAVDLHDLLNTLNFRSLVITDGLDSLGHERSQKVKETLVAAGFEEGPEDIEVYYWKDRSLWGEVLYAENRIEEAVQCFEKVLAEDPSHLNALNNLGVIFCQLSRLEEAEGLLRRALGLNRRNLDALVNLSHVYFRMERFGDAAGLFKKAASLQRTNPSLWFHLGFCYERLNRVTEAIEAYRRCDDLGDKEWQAGEKIATLQRIVTRDRPERTSVSILSPKKILVISNIYPPQELGGFGRRICDFAGILKKRGHCIHVLTSNTPYLGRIEQDEPEVDRSLLLFGGWHKGAAARIEDKTRIDRIIRENVLRVRQVMKEFSPDLCYLGNADFLSERVFEPLLEGGIPVFHHLGNPRPGYSVENAPGGKSYRLITVSRWLREEILRQGYPFPDIGVIYPGVFVRDFEMAVPPATDKLRIVYAGLVSPYKGIQILIDALYILHQLGVDFSCSVAGGATDESYAAGLKQAVKDAGMNDKIGFVGFLNRGQLVDLYARHNILVLPSVFQEPTGNSQMEAMAAGLLVINSGTGGSKEIAVAGSSGLSFQSEDQESLARVLLGVLDDRERWEKIAAEGQERARTHFDNEIAVNRLEEEFASILDPERCASGNIPFRMGAG
jgi:FkbM family methyltransferase